MRDVLAGEKRSAPRWKHASFTAPGTFLHRRQLYPPPWLAIMAQATSAVVPRVQTVGEATRGSERPSAPCAMPGGGLPPLPDILVNGLPPATPQPDLCMRARRMRTVTAVVCVCFVCTYLLITFVVSANASVPCGSIV